MKHDDGQRLIAIDNPKKFPNVSFSQQQKNHFIHQCTQIGPITKMNKKQNKTKYKINTCNTKFFNYFTNI